jgi:hypothetical protein
MVERIEGMNGGVDQNPFADWPEDMPEPVPWPAVRGTQKAQTDGEIAVLEESIKREGVKYPPILMPDGLIVDGHLRIRLAIKLGVKLPLLILLPEGTTDEQALNLARELQYGRRNLGLTDWQAGRAAIREYYLTLRRRCYPAGGGPWSGSPTLDRKGLGASASHTKAQFRGGLN